MNAKLLQQALMHREIRARNARAGDELRAEDGLANATSIRGGTAAICSAIGHFLAVSRAYLKRGDALSRDTCRA